MRYMICKYFLSFCGLPSHFLNNTIHSTKYFNIDESNLSVLRFPEMSEEWLDFIAACRTGVPHDYDVVEGPMADDTIFNYVQSYLDGEISRAAFWELAKFKYPTHQISFHSAKALSALRFERSYEVNV